MRNKRKWTLKDQAVLLNRLSHLLKEGYTLNEAMNFLSVNEKGIKKDDLNESVSRLAAGFSLRYVFEQLNFHRDVLSFLYFAEQYGDMDFALKESSEILDKKISNLEKISKIIRYPIFLIFIVIVILIFVQSVITPQFEQLYTSMNMETSFFTTFLGYVFSSLKWCAFVFAASFVVLMYYYFFAYKKKSIENQMRILIRIPIIKTFYLMIFSYFFAFQLSTLLRGGMSIFESLRTFEKQKMFPFFQEEARYLIGKLKTGLTLHEIIQQRGFYEHELSLVILHGQANGQLARELYTYSQLVIEKMENRINKAITYIQPTVYIFVGIVVLFVYLSMLLPMYKMMESI